MSRVAKKPVVIPAGVEVNISGLTIKVKGSKGVIETTIPADVEIKKEDDTLLFAPNKGADASYATAGTARALVNNMIIGVTQGFERKLLLVGVGFKSQVKGKILDLSLGFSHPVNYKIPEGITIETPAQTEILVKGVDKHLVGQVASEIRAFRPPEPYKGKGVKYEGEVIVRKEGKKK